MRKCAIVIPIYYNDLKDYELDSIYSARRNFYKEDIYIICPETLYISSIEQDEKHIIRLDKKYFESIKSYNKLCTSTFFYKIFLDKGYEYMLIHQLDAYTYQNNLDYFISFGYDWYGAYVGLGHKQGSLWYGSNVGNGGYSLRKLSKMIEITEKYGSTDKPEDAWFCGVHKNDLNICTEKLAKEFSTFGIPKTKYETMGMHGTYVKNKSYKQIDKKNNIVVYTTLIGDYDTLNEVYMPSENIDYIRFTDNPTKKKTWKILPIPSEIKNYEKKLQNKFLKFFPDLFLSEYDISLLCDANIELIGNIENFISTLNFNKYNMFFKTHPECNDIYTECDRCVKANRETQEVASLLKEKYSKEGMPKNYGLFECNFIVRKHNEDNVKHLMKLWWDEVNKISKRDQLSFTYLLWKHNLKDTIGVIDFKDLENKVYKKHLHNKGIYSKPPTNENVKNNIINNLTLYRTYYLDTQFKSYNLDKDPNYVVPINTNDKKYQLSSKLNKYWSEYALMTEIAKEGKKTQYIGFDQFAQKLDISIIINNPGYDIYFNKSMKNTVLKDQFNRFHCKDDMDNVISILNELYGNGNKYTNALTNKTTFYYESCFIMKWEIFNEFCNFLSEILDKLDKKYKLEYKPEKYKEFFSNPSRKYGSSYSIKPGYQDRAFGFLSERLLSIFISENYKNTTLVLNEPRTINTSTVIKDRDTDKNNITEKKIVVIDKENIRTTNTFKPKRTTQNRNVHFLRRGISW